MGFISVITGILSWIQVGLGQAPISATTLYHGAVLVDKATTEDFRGTWSAEIQEQGIKTVKSFIMQVEDNRTTKGHVIEVKDSR
jgi:hypothetical protein